MEQFENSSDQVQDVQKIREKQDIRKKKIIKGVLIFSGIVIVLSMLLSAMDPYALVQKMFGKDTTTEQQISFYPVDDPWNYPDNEEYQDMDRRLFVHNPFEGTTYSVEESQLSGEDEFVAFFYDYFQAIIQGDVEAVLAMYAADYQGSVKLPATFTSQMVYDITLYPQTESGSVSSYRVDYRIYRNNGTLRNDVGSDTIRPLIFTLIEENGELKIYSVVPYTSVRK